MARREIADVHASGRTPILVGGTGLYLRTLLDGIAPVPAIDPEVRARVREAPVEENRAKLETLDPAAAARLKPARHGADQPRAGGDPLDRANARRMAAAARRRDRRRGRASAADPAAAAQLALRALRRALRAHDRPRRGRGSRGAARAQARPEPAGDARDRRARDCRPICSGETLARRGRSPRASRRPAATPSANIPGSRTSRRRTGRAFSEALDVDRLGEALALLQAEAARRRRWTCCATPTSIPPRSPASASRSSATATRAARRRSTCTTAGSTWSSACAAARAARSKPKPPGSRPRCSRTPSRSADVVMMLAPDEIHAALYREIEPHLRKGAALGFSHGLSVRFGFVEPRADLDVFLVAPKGPGTALRSLYREGKGMIALWAVAQDATGSAREHRARLRPRDRLRPRRPDRVQLRRGSRSRSVQRAGGGVGRSSRAADRRLRDPGRRRRLARSRLSRMRRRAEADRRADRGARHRRDARGDLQHRRARRAARRQADRRRRASASGWPRCSRKSAPAASPTSSRHEEASGYRAAGAGARRSARNACSNEPTGGSASEG